MQLAKMIRVMIECQPELVKHLRSFIYCYNRFGPQAFEMVMKLISHGKLRYLCLANLRYTGQVQTIHLSLLKNIHENCASTL